jgi:hypothetical protein
LWRWSARYEIVSVVANDVLHTTDHDRHGSRAFLRLELEDDEVIVVVHEVGPEHVRDDSPASRDRWQTWQSQLEPPTLADDAGTAYVLSPRRRATGTKGPSTARVPLKATVSWHFQPAPRPEARRWTVDGRWTVERR